MTMLVLNLFMPYLLKKEKVYRFKYFDFNVARAS